MLLPVSVRLQLGDAKLEGATQVPAAAVGLPAMLPTFRALADGLVGLGIGESEKPVSCGKGCAACCRMAVPISEPEAHRLRAGMAVFRDTGLLADMFQRVRDEDTQKRAVANIDGYFAKGVACPFLEDESCSIYEERPLVCREFLVTSPAANCSDIDGAGVERLPMRARPGDALILIASKNASKSDESGPVAVLPLIQLLEWTAEHPLADADDKREGVEWLGAFVEMLQAKASNA